MEDEAGHENGDVHTQINAITDESLESTRRMLALCDESKEAAISTLVNLDDQVHIHDHIYSCKLGCTNKSVAKDTFDGHQSRFKFAGTQQHSCSDVNLRLLYMP